MPRRSPLFPRTAFVVILAIGLSGCAEDDITAPKQSVSAPSGPSMGITYVNGNVTMIDLGILSGGIFSDAADINDAGVIVGRMSTTQHPPCAPQLSECIIGLVWPSPQAAIVSYPDPTQCATGPHFSALTSINDSGVIVGDATCYAAGWPFAFSRSASGAVVRLPSLAVSPASVVDINNMGFAVGSSVVGFTGGQGEYRAVMWDLTGPTITVTNLGDPLGGTRSEARAINDAGMVVGITNSGMTARGFVRPVGGPMIDIGVLPGDVSSHATGVSESGIVVGYSVSSSFQARAFTWTQAGGMHAIGGLGTYSRAFAVNDDGIVVGQFTTLSGQGRAFAWKAGVVVDLGVLPGYHYSTAYAINAAGEIVGESSSNTGGRHAAYWKVAFAGSTPTGDDVSVQPTDETTGEPAPVQISFDNVTGGGETTVTSGTVGGTGSPPAPGSFRLGTPPTYYNVETTATFSGAITLCFSYSGANYGNEGILKLLHYENGTWTDVTTSLDTVNDVICGSVTSLSPFLVAEENAAPVVTAIALPSAPVPVGTSVSVTASFTDANPGDAHAATITWDDGTTSPLSVTESGGAGSASASHTYTVPGVYTLQVSVNDGDLSDTRSSIEEQPAYIVVYDPTSGFVTGGGWIDSPVGACLWTSCAGDGSTIGKATFGFVSRYKNGASTPTGETEFQFKAGGLAFRSTSYQWLVVAGERAQYKGEGDIAGSTGAYGFLLTGIDGALQGDGGVDRFRIKIWDKASGAIVYDNKLGQAEDSGEATALGGGSIVIHK